MVDELVDDRRLRGEGTLELGRADAVVGLERVVLEQSAERLELVLERAWSWIKT